jgi:peptide/nickel transport system ATP-binding protein
VSTPLLEIKNVSKRYTLPREHLFVPAPEVLALRDVTLSLTSGKSLGIVGESGSGKSTLARMAMAIEAPSNGGVLFKGQNLNALSATDLRQARAGFQMVFQDPYGSLNPRLPIWRTVAEPLAALQNASRAQQKESAAEILQAVGLGADMLDHFPHEFSGGQRQRIAIARALITRPALIVADEPVSALDVSVQAQVLNLMIDLQAEFKVTYLLISHDLAVVRHLCEEVAVMQAGKVVELAATDELFARPQHAYTQELLQAVS